MTQDKMRRVITACVSAATLLFVMLVAILVYQWIAGAVLDNRIEELQRKNAQIEEDNKEMNDLVNYLESPIGKEWLAFQEGFVRGNK